MKKYIHTTLKGTLTAILLMVGVSAWAQNVAKIGTTEYATLQAAIDAANQASEATTITLLANVTINDRANVLIIKKAMTLDMGGKTITSTVEEPFLINGYEADCTGDLTITGKGTITGPTGETAKQLDGKAMITVRGTNAHLTFVNGTMTCGGAGSDGMYGVYILESGSAVFGEQESETGPSITAWFAAVGENNTTAPANITIYGGTYEQDATPSESDWWEYFCAPVYASASGTVAIEGGTFNGRYAFASRYGNVAQTLNISGGTFNGTKTALLIGSVSGDGDSGDRTIAISGGEFSTAIPTEYCAEGFAPMEDENGKYTVVTPEEAETEAEALSNGTYYKVLDKAITVAGTTATTITLLKDPAAEALTIPASADITLSIADEVELTTPITNSGKLTVASGTISGDITINKADGTVKIANGVTSTYVVAISTELQNDNVLKTSTTKEAGYTSYWVEKKFEAKVSLAGEPTSEQTSAAEALAANSSISSVTGLADNQSLTIIVTSVTLTSSKVTKAAFEVKLIGADGQVKTEAESAVTFRLPIASSVAENAWVNLWHNSTAITGATVQGRDDNKFVAISTTSFSPFSYEIIENPVAQIDLTKYASVADAITAATSEETKIKLLKNVDTDIEITADKKVLLTIGEHTVSGAITNNSTLTLADGTISGAITNTGALTISGVTISGAITASAGTLAISGGTISNTITTSGDAALTISGGTMDHAITIGGSGANTISGGTISGAVTTSAATTISGGTFDATSSITNSTALSITGGIFEFSAPITNNSPGTVAISGGTHTVLPVSAFCATGYMPIKNEAGKYNMTNKWTITDATVIDASHFEYLTTAAGYKVATATYNRNTGMVSAGNAETKYGTICLPFNINAQPTGMTLYKATEISGSTLTISPVTYDSPVAAGTPLIFELNAVASNMTVTSTNDGGIAVNTTAPETSPVTGNLLVGTYTQKIISSGLPGNIYYLNGDKFHQAMQSLTVPAFRAYLDTTSSPSPAPSMLSIVKEGDEETAIQQIESLETVTEVYDLNGRKLNGLQRGVNIMRRADGSTIKVIVK